MLGLINFGLNNRFISIEILDIPFEVELIKNTH